MWRSGTGGTAHWYYEDFTEDREFDLGEAVVDGAEMIDFARRFDPQWYHLDPAVAAEGPFGAVTASGWFTASLFMRMYADAVLTHAAADASPGVEELRWTAPVYAGDRLSGRLFVLGKTPSKSRPGLGTVSLSAVVRCEERDTDVLRIRFRGWFGMRERGQTFG